MAEREKRSLNLPAGQESNVNIMLNTSPSSGARDAGMPMFPARKIKKSLESAPGSYVKSRT